MQIIPVLDIVGAQVVHARGGQRDGYRPLNCTLCKSSDPRSVVDALLAVHAFPTIYVADLDAIERRGDNAATLSDLAAAFPQLHWWVDAGLSRSEQYRRRPQRGSARAVIGSESLSDSEWMAELDTHAASAPALLSLDFRADRLLGPSALLNQPERWPRDVIVMQLDRVGAARGPDLKRLAAIAAVARAGTRLYSAGGVRDAGDLASLAAARVSGVLLASALYEGRIAAGDICATSRAGRTQC